MRLSSMADYAVLTMTAAARHCGSGLLARPNGERRAMVSAAQLAEETGLPAPTVQKVVSKLSAADRSWIAGMIAKRRDEIRGQDA